MDGDPVNEAKGMPAWDAQSRAVPQPERHTRVGRQRPDREQLPCERFRRRPQDGEYRLTLSFAATIRRDVLASVVGVIELEPYERFFRPALPPGHPYREPYLLCLQACMERANHWLGHPPVPEDERTCSP